MAKETVGFIGQGFIGKHMADDFEARGYPTVRYSLDAPYVANKAAIADCPVTFIAVPTPTTPDGFDASLVAEVLPLIGDGHAAVIKSTILPGTTEELQRQFPAIHVLHAPEFLRETSAAHDIAHPERTIVGFAHEDDRALAEHIVTILPPSPHTIVTAARNAECIKYIGNTFLYTKVVFMNIAYEFTQAAGADWETVRSTVAHDARIGAGHTEVLHDSGRGAGGHCFIKDFEALLEFYETHSADTAGSAALRGLRAKNNQLLVDSRKDLELLRGVYGPEPPVASA